MRVVHRGGPPWKRLMQGTLALTLPSAQAKCELEDEMRVVHLVSSMGYAELLQQARAKFPGAPPFVIKYLDRRAGPARRGRVAAAVACVWVCSSACWQPRRPFTSSRS